jgi:hypothetical protein
MKKIWMIAIIAVALLLSPAIRADMVRLQELSYGGKTRVFEVDRDLFMRSGKLSPETEALVPSIQEASQLILEYSKAHHPQVKEFLITSISLNSVLLSTAPRRWYFYFRINPVVEGEVANTTTFDLIMLFDRTIISAREL